MVVRGGNSSNKGEKTMAIVENIEENIEKIEAFSAEMTEKKAWKLSHHPAVLAELIDDCRTTPKRQTVYLAQMKTVLRKYDNNPLSTRSDAVVLTGENLETLNRITAAFSGVDLGDDAEFFLDTVTPKSSKKNPNPRYESVQDAIFGKVLRSVESALLDIERGDN